MPHETIRLSLIKTPIPIAARPHRIYRVASRRVSRRTPHAPREGLRHAERDKYDEGT